nr:hypothetical protein Cplu_290 [Cedratvirus plubellavi]
MPSVGFALAIMSAVKLALDREFLKFSIQVLVLLLFFSIVRQCFLKILFHRVLFLHKSLNSLSTEDRASRLSTFVFPRIANITSVESLLIMNVGRRKPSNEMVRIIYAWV